MQHTPEACFLTDGRGITTVANAAAATLFGVSEDFFRGRPLINVVARQDTRAFRAIVEELGKAFADTTRVETVRVRPRGRPVLVARVRAVRIDGGSDMRIYWVLTPVA
jgi:PAS domain S-box-containing protein